MGEPVKRGAVPRLSVEARAGAQRAATADPSPMSDLDRRIKIAVVSGGLVVLAAGLVLGSVLTKIVVSLMCLVMLQGLWRGAGELVGLVASSLVAVILAPALGRAFEGVFGGILGTSGILNRMISIAVIGLDHRRCGHSRYQRWRAAGSQEASAVGEAQQPDWSWAGAG